MGRKGAEEQRDMSSDEFRYQRAYMDEQRRERRAGRDQLMPEYLKMYQDSFGYEPEGFQSKLFSPEQRSNILSSSVRSARTPYEDAASTSQARLARTGNSAGYGALQGELARGKSLSIADVTRKAETEMTSLESQEGFNRMGWLEDQRYRRQQGGLAGLAALFGIDTQLLASTAGGANAALQSHGVGIEPGKWETIANPIIAATGQALSGGPGG